MFTRIRVNWRGMSAENYGTFLYIFPPRYTRDVPDEIICALAAIRIPESRTCHLVETDQDQKVGGEGASQISRTRASQDWNWPGSGTNPVARTGRRPVAGLTNIRVNYSAYMERSKHASSTGPVIFFLANSFRIKRVTSVATNLLLLREGDGDGCS